VSELLVVEPVFAERLWGGTTLRHMFGANVPDGVIGECWALSGMEDMSGLVHSDGPADGLTLREAWQKGYVTGTPRDDDLPILCKFLDPQDWLSVQVHPNDEQARELEGQPRGKAESWLVVSCQPGAELILGHTAASGSELRESMLARTLMSHLTHVKVQPDDFFMVAAGEVHSLGPGMLVYEVQQSSDITYRLYDFDRVGLDGRPRELHVDKGFSVVIPHDAQAANTAGPWEDLPSRSRRRTLVECPQFRVSRWETLHGEFTLEASSYRLITVIGGGATLTTAGGVTQVGLGTSLVVPAGTGPVHVFGTVMMVVTDPGHALA
jgi:mannose-6-phosphate isomerase